MRNYWFYLPVNVQAIINIFTSRIFSDKLLKTVLMPCRVIQRGASIIADVYHDEHDAAEISAAKYHRADTASPVSHSSHIKYVVLCGNV